jgi:hypothetical protein
MASDMIDINMIYWLEGAMFGAFYGIFVYIWFKKRSSRFKNGD